MLSWVVAALAVLVPLYAGTKTVIDLRNRRWLWAILGLSITIGAPIALGIMAQLMFEYRRQHEP